MQSFGLRDMSADIREMRKLAFYYIPSMLLPRLESRYVWGFLEAFGNLEEGFLGFWSSLREERRFILGSEGCGTGDGGGVYSGYLCKAV